MSATKIITILGLIWCGYAAAEFTTWLNKKEHTDSGEFKFGMKHMPKGRQYFSYGICKHSDSSHSTECNVLRESLNNGKKNGSSCHVSLNGIASGLQLHDFDDNKVIIYWYNANDKLPNYYLRFTIVQFSNCSTAEAKIKYDLQELRDFNYDRSLGTILPQDDQFTVASDNSGIFGNNIDKQTFDASGNLNSKADTWFKPLSKVSMMVIDNFGNDNQVLLEFDFNNYQTRFSLLNEFGLKVLNTSTFGKIETVYYDVSALHDTLRLCRLNQPSSKIDCDAFNAYGKLISRSTLELNHSAMQLAVYNLADQSFFIITAVASSQTSEKHFYINKFSAEGKRNATVELPGFECNGEDQVNVYPYENEQNQHCVMRICINYKVDFDAVVKCFNNEDIA